MGLNHLIMPPMVFPRNLRFRHLVVFFTCVNSWITIDDSTPKDIAVFPPLIVPAVQSKNTANKEDDSSANEDLVPDDKSTCNDDHQIMNMLLKHYNKNKIPRPNEKTVLVLIEIWVQDISQISDITQDFVLTVYVTESWRDPGLEFYSKNPCKPNMTLNQMYIDRLWVPNLTFINSKAAHFHKSPFLNFWLFLESNGTLWMNYRMNLTVPCDTDLTAFPMDHRVCSVEFESYNHHNGEVTMRWKPSGAIAVLQTVTEAWKARSSEPKGNMNVGNLKIYGYILSSVDNTTKSKAYPAGDWDELSMVFVFKRRYGWYLIQVYVPSYLAIFTSWITFTFGPKAIPARCMCVVNSLLTLTFQFETIFRELPRVSYVKAIDIWMMGCTAFVFAAMVELSIIGNLKDSIKYRGDPDLTMHPGRKERYAKPPSASYLKRRRLATITELYEIAHADRRYDHANESDSFDSIASTAAPDVFSFDEQLSNDGQSEASSVVYESTTSLQIKRRHICSVGCRIVCCKLAPLDPYCIDNISILLFPACFSIFNIGYWAYYVSKYKSIV